MVFTLPYLYLTQSPGIAIPLSICVDFHVDRGRTYTIIWIRTHPGLCNDCFVCRIIIAGIVLRSRFHVQYQHSQTGRYLIHFIIYLQSISFDMHYTVASSISPITCCMYTQCEIILWWWWYDNATSLSFQSSIDIL